MEEEDFGFTKRDLKVLRNALISQTAEKGTNSKTHETNSEQVESTGAEYRDNIRKKINDDADHDQDNVGLGSMEGDDGGGRSDVREQETGNGSGAIAEGKIINEKSSVVEEPPNIPNVVEYHLKVKASSKISCSLKKERDFHPQKEKGEKLSSEEFQSKMALKNNNKGINESAIELPQTFQVKYLGSHDARGLWGIKHTRRPVDNMVTAARSLPAGTILPFIKLIVSKEGVGLLPFGKKRHDAGISKQFAIDTISYGVQDLVYTRVFSMIVVRDIGQNNQGVSPFECHGFVCESRQHARQLTYALANAFQIYSLNVKAQGKAEETTSNIKKRFAIDLRSPEEIEADLTIDSEA